MNLKKSLIIGASVLALAPVASATFVSSNANADEIAYEEVNKDYQVYKNQTYIEFESELLELENANVQLTDEDIVNLFEKYEGATVTVTPTNNSSLRAASASGSSYQIVNGGVNAFASNKESMKSLATTFSQQAQAITVGGIAVGMPFSGYGALITGIPALAVATKFSDASRIMNEWYNSSATQGGVRMTVTEQRPISSPTATAKATIP